MDGLADALARDGYLELAPCLDPALVARCRDAILAARDAGVATVGAFAFDAPWELAVALGPIAAAALGAPALRQPAFWAWYVDGDGERRGWPPHRDNPDAEIADDGRPEAVSLWVPVTEARADNGCMYLVPAPWDIQYGNPRATSEILSLQTVRAMPAAPGAVLGWTPRLLHWSGLARPGTPPRLSLSIEFQRADRPPIDGTVAALDQVPRGAARAAAILAQWDRYAHMHEQPPAARAALAAFVAALGAR